MNWRNIPDKPNLVESDDQLYVVMQNRRFTPPIFVAFKRQYERVKRARLVQGKGRAKKFPKAQPRWAPPLLLGSFDDLERAKSACELDMQSKASAA